MLFLFPLYRDLARAVVDNGKRNSNTEKTTTWMRMTGNEVGGEAEINARNLLVKKSADAEMSKTCVLRRRREGEVGVP